MNELISMIELFKLLLSKVTDIFGDGVMLNVIDFGHDTMEKINYSNHLDASRRSQGCSNNAKGSLSCIGTINSKYPHLFRKK